LQNKIKIQGRKFSKWNLNGTAIISFLKTQAIFSNKEESQEWIVVQNESELAFVSLESDQIHRRQFNSLTKDSVIKLNSHNALVIWSKKSNGLQIIDIPFDTASPKSLPEVYKFENEDKFVKRTEIAGKEYLLVIDKPKYIKLLFIDQEKVVQLKEFFVPSNFDLKLEPNIQKVDFASGMLMMDEHAFLLNDKVDEVNS